MYYTRLYIILLVLFFAGCTKDKSTSLFGEKPEERMGKVLADYKARLTESTYGWKTAVYPSNGGAYSFFFTFGTDDRMTMYSDVTVAAGGTAKGSTYRLKAVQRPSLLFDTYSYLHLLADPDPAVYGGQIGHGFSIDFEYAIDSAVTDTIKLTGITYGTKMILVKANEAEYNAYTAGQLGEVVSATEDYIQQTPWLYLQFEDGKRLQVSINTYLKTFALTYIDDAGQVQSLTSAYYYTPDGIYLQTPVAYGSNTFHEIFWDDVNQVFYVSVNGVQVTVKVASSPVIPMHELLGIDFTSLIVPPDEIPGWSTDFTSVYKAAATSIRNGPYALTLYYTEFVFNTAESVMNIDVYIIQGNSLYLARYPFTYAKTASGVFKFTGRSYSGNAATIAEDMSPLLDYIRNDRFTMDFYIDAEEGKLGQLKSMENTGFYFTGYMQ